MASKRTYITDFIGLDLLRFFLAITVVIRHYYHFYGPFKDSPFTGFGQNITIEPFYNTFNLVYNNGHYAVQVFWLISGLIFYTIYENAISGKQISFGKYAFLRFTRLYPLHLVTLLLVAGLQMLYYSQHGEYFVYQVNDLSRFFLQLFFMDAWLPTENHSFNIPTWSVSVEVFVYVIYFLVSSANLAKGKKLWLIFLFTIVITAFNILLPFNRCLMFFFGGCLLADYMQKIGVAKLIAVNFAIIAAMTAATKLFKSHLIDEPGFLNADFIYTVRLIFVSAMLVLIFILLFRSLKSKFLLNLFKSLGNMTYSVYLVHMPVQIVMFMVLNPESYTIFNSPTILLTFLVISLVVGWVAFELFEKPAQQYLRGWYDNFKSRKLEKAAPRLKTVEPNI